MNRFDRLARDLTFEIALGNEYLSHKDLQDGLNGCSYSELGLFRDRVRYFAGDFFNSDHIVFVNVLLENWMKDIKDNGKFDIRPEFKEMARRRDRGKWFKTTDGDVVRCSKALIEFEYSSSFIECHLVPEMKPYDTCEAAKIRACHVLKKFGKETTFDWPVVTTDLDVMMKDYYFDLKLRCVGTLDDLRSGRNDSKPEELVFFITYRDHPLGNFRSVLFSELPEDGLLEVMDHMHDKLHMLDIRDYSMPDITSSPESSPNSVAISIRDVEVDVVYPDSPYSSETVRFRPEIVFSDDSGRVLVGGHMVGQDKSLPRTNFLLHEFSDAGIKSIKEATSHVLRQISENLNGSETLKEGRKGPKNDGKMTV